MSLQIALEIFQEIKKKNELTNNDSIPHSDSFIHFLNMSIGIEPGFAKQLIKALIDSHMIFAIEIVGEDKSKNIPRVEGYVECDLKTLRRLKLHFQDELMRIYEAEHYKRVNYHQIIKEIMPVIDSLNNTLTGQIVNKAVMMAELERMMERNFNEFTDEWREENLNIEINKVLANVSKAEIKQDKKETVETKPRLRGKSAEKKMFADLVAKGKHYPLDRIIKIYGIDFFFKSQIKQQQFDYLARLIDTGKFFNDTDLLKLRKMIYNIKKKTGSDTVLLNKHDEILNLERSIILSLFKNEKKGHEKNII